MSRRASPPSVCLPSRRATRELAHPSSRATTRSTRRASPPSTPSTATARKLRRGRRRRRVRAGGTFLEDVESASPSPSRKRPESAGDSTLSGGSVGPTGELDRWSLVIGRRRVRGVLGMGALGRTGRVPRWRTSISKRCALGSRRAGRRSAWTARPWRGCRSMRRGGPSRAIRRTWRRVASPLRLRGGERNFEHTVGRGDLVRVERVVERCEHRAR